MKFRLLAFLAASAPALLAAPLSGEAVYQKRCAACHDSPASRAPARDSLKTRSVLSIQRTLDFGIMSNIAGPMRRDERDAVAGWLGVAGASSTPPAQAFCTDRSVELTASPVGWNGWSASAGNTRFQSAGAAGLNLDGVRRLKLKWAYGFDGDAVAFAQPTVLDRQIFVGSASGLVQALAMDTGCIKWVFQATGPVRSAILAVPSGNTHMLLFGDQVGWFYALDAKTGRQLWKKRPEPHESTRLTGAPTAYQGTVFVPVSSFEETRTLDPDYPCCTFRGSIVAYRISDGSQLWKTYTIPQKAKATGGNKWGPSGASVWGSPTLDAKRGLLYATTGDNFSLPSSGMSDSVFAMELATGRIVWFKQTLPGDIWTSGCAQRGDCPGPDHDYGSSVLLEKLDNGRDILLAGQKSGVVYALDPEKKGEILWQVRVGKGGVNGGVQWGMASDGLKVYAATSDVVRGGSNPDKSDPLPLPLDPKAGGGLTALRIANGEKVWYTPPAACGPKPGCSPAQSGAVTAIPGVVFSGALDGHLRAYSAEEGKVLWDFDTLRDYQTVNGVRASGGALNGPGPVVVGGMVLVNSGYGRSGGLAGNVLLAFAPE